MEQQFTMKKLKMGEKNRTAKDLNTVVESLIHQNFCLSNTIKELIKQWPIQVPVDPSIIKEALSKSGISSEIKI
jgi:hypothetical protein